MKKGFGSACLNNKSQTNRRAESVMGSGGESHRNQDRNQSDVLRFLFGSNVGHSKMFERFVRENKNIETKRGIQNLNNAEEETQRVRRSGKDMRPVQ